MRSSRGAPGGAETRSARADAAARRLALLADDIGADIGADVGADVDPDARAGPLPAEPPPLPAPGRHAARRRRRPPALLGGLPRLGAPQLTVVAVVVALGLALTTWWVVRDRAEQLPVTTAGPAGTAAPLVSLPAATGAPTDPTASSSPATGPGAPAEASVTVDVAGKVRRPGIVVLDAGARVVDALEAAGGARRGVDLTGLNLARQLVDGEQVVVGAPTTAVPAPPSGPAPLPGAPTALVDLNTASVAELETLPEVGPVTAQAIVTWREQNGGFTSVEELLAVDGIGEVTLERLLPFVTV